MGHAKDPAIDVKVAGDSVPVSLGSFALERKLQGLPNIDGGKMHIIFGNISHLAPKVFLDFFGAKTRIINRPCDTQVRGMLVGNRTKERRASSSGPS